MEEAKERRPVWRSTVTTRDDDFNITPISSTIIRQDLIRDDYNAFRSAYDVPYDSVYIDERTIKDYYDRLEYEIKKPVNETAAAGRIPLCVLPQWQP